MPSDEQMSQWTRVSPIMNDILQGKGLVEVATGTDSGGSGMLVSVNSRPWLPLDRQREIDTRLVSIRARLKELRERDRDAITNRAASANERLDEAQRHAARAYAAAASALMSSAEAFRTAAQAHERVASVHERMAAATGIDDAREHEWQAARHRAAATADWQRAERAQALLLNPEGAGLTIDAEQEKPAGSVDA